MIDNILLTASTKDNTSAANVLFTTCFILFDCQAIGDNGNPVLVS